MEIPAVVMERVREWLTYEYDPQTREDVQWLLDNDNQGLLEAFGAELEFGTGGLRGLMGVGPNRLNVYTVRRATQGLANYLCNAYSEAPEIRVAIAYDCRNNSALFAEAAADTLTANGVRVYLYEALRATPQLSYTVRALHCHAGIVVTASHNPKEYNGYKVYWGDGGQVTPPHDGQIIEEVRRVSSFAQVKRNGDKGLIVRLGGETDEAYLSMLLAGAMNPASVNRDSGCKIVYTPIHGTGTVLLPRALKRLGFSQVHVVTKQREPDGNFSTVASPNPENPEAMALAVELAKEVGADLVLGTDPDADRMGVYIRDNGNALFRLNGNQIAVLLFYFIMETLRGGKRMPKKPYIVRSIVTTPLLDALAKDYRVKSYQVLTGFKYVASCIAAKEGKECFVAGAEESHGYLMGDAVRDKDAVQACMLFAELVAWCKRRDTTPYEVLEAIYTKYGFYLEGQRSVVREGLDGQKEIAAIMARLRENTPVALGGEQVVRVLDYQSGTATTMPDGDVELLDFPRSNVLQLETNEGTTITVRPSGTEPKIKYYCSVHYATGQTLGDHAWAQKHLEDILAELAQ